MTKQVTGLFMLTESRQKLSKITVPHISIGNSQIVPASHARNLGFILDSAMTLKPHTCISNISRSASYHIRNISKIRKYLNHDSTVHIVHSFITSHIDTCNSVLYGLPQDQLNHLQRIENTAAHVVCNIIK